MKRLTLLALALLGACTMTVKITAPYCPVSDSAKAAADSIPLGCEKPR